ncbi:hypothetical protein FACS1894122_03420 [Alphaproteobacteria bacterium]|nr:hypothetical protein FACS1894122_03420 [Alphaproteobacteria bacterium]
MTQEISGISEDHVKIIKNILEKHFGQYEFFLYGSRVKGNFSNNSDLDLLIKGDEKASFDILDDIKNMFDESTLPFIVHISDFHKMDPCFFKLLKDDLIKL